MVLGQEAKGGTQGTAHMLAMGDGGGVVQSGVRIDLGSNPTSVPCLPAI